MSTDFTEPDVWGWRHDLEDSQFLRSQLPLSYMAPEYHLETFDPWSIPGFHIWDQAQMGSCSGHMDAMLNSYIDWLTTGTWFDFCRMFSYITGQRECGLVGSDNGATISGQLQAAKKYGRCLESEWPYTGYYTTQIPQKCYDQAKDHKVTEFCSPRSYEEIMNLLQTFRGAPGLGIDWGGCVISQGYIIEDYRPNPNPNARKGHAVPFVGWYGDDPWLVNSWSERAGRKGLYLFKRQAVEKVCRDQGAEVVGYINQKPFYPGNIQGRDVA